VVSSTKANATWQRKTSKGSYSMTATAIAKAPAINRTSGELATAGAVNGAAVSRVTVLVADWEASARVGLVEVLVATKIVVVVLVETSVVLLASTLLPSPLDDEALGRSELLLRCELDDWTLLVSPAACAEFEEEAELLVDFRELLDDSTYVTVVV
jgi:hypothetical protein